MTFTKVKISPDSRVIFATFSPWVKGVRLPTNGSLEPLRDFLVSKVKKLVLIDQPVPGSDFVMPRIEVYRKNKKYKLYRSSIFMFLLLPFLWLANKPGTRISFKLRDFLSIIDWVLKDKVHYDFLIGLESVNAISGIFLRKLGLISRVIYYVSDYSPNRYPQKWFNWLYLALDKFCVMHADYIWDVSKAIHPARIAAGLDPNKSVPVIHMPNGLYKSQIKHRPLNEIQNFTLAYMGTLGIENGPDLALEALEIVVKKYPQTILNVIGGGNKDLERLKNKVSELELSKQVIFHGFLPKASDMAKILRFSAVALALYRSIPGSPRYFGDAGKIRAYCAAGLPIITTDVPPLGREVAEKHAALMVKDTKEDIALAIIKLFSDRKLYVTLRNNAIKFAQLNTWENEFARAFKQIDQYENKH